MKLKTQITIICILLVSGSLFLIQTYQSSRTTLSDISFNQFVIGEFEDKEKAAIEHLIIANRLGISPEIDNMLVLTKQERDKLILNK